MFSFRIRLDHSVQEVFQFFENFGQCIASDKDNSNSVYNYLSANRNKLSRDFLLSFKKHFSFLLKNLQEEEERRRYANLVFEFGKHIEKFPLGQPELNVEFSIAAYEMSLNVTPRGKFPIQWGYLLGSLGNGYSARLLGDKSESIEKAISCYHQCLQVIKFEAMPKDWAMTMNGLGNAYFERIQGHRPNNIALSIDYHKKALFVRTRESMPTEWAQSNINLATAYSENDKGGRGENIKLAISHYEKALEVISIESAPTDWATATDNLAVVYKENVVGDLVQNIEKAINLHKKVLEIRNRQDMPLMWAITNHHLANAFRERAIGEHAENIEASIFHLRQALEIFDEDTMPAKWATAMNSLGMAYAGRIKGSKEENIEEALLCYKSALQVSTSKASPLDWARLMINIGSAFAVRVEGNRSENIENAISHYQQALTVITQKNMPIMWATTLTNLANTYTKSIGGHHQENVRKSIDAYRKALTVLEPELMPEECRRAAQGLANLYTQAQDWAEAVTVYEIGLRAVDALYQSAALLDSKASVLTETTDLYRRATYALARNGSFNQTVETIERGRARSLSEILNRDRASLVNLQDIRFDLYTQYISMVRQIRGIETKQRDRAVSQERHSITPETLMEHAATLHHQLKILIQEIREVPGYKSFLSLSTFNDVQKAAHIDCPLIYLLSTPDGSLALIVTPQDSQSIFLDGFAEEQLRQILQAWFLGYKQAQNEVTASSFKNCQPWLKTIDSVTEQIWETLMQPLTHHLKSHNFNRAILIPTGYLNLLPLHAAWTEDKTCSTGRRYAFDEIHFIYAPNAKSFTASRAITKRVQAQSILAIDNPQADLPNSEREVNAAICSFSDRTILRHYEATVAAVKAQLSAASVAHFSCHGTANLTEPLNSGLLMHDGLLTLKDIFALNLVETGGLRLAVLSACETGLQGIENADEAISLPTGLLQAGVAAVISSLWSVSDLSTMMLLTRFYDFWRTEGLEISQALRQAQQWVRDTTNGEKAAYFKDFVPTQSVSKMPASTADHLYKSLILSDPNARDFAHPFHWAAFSYTGA